MVKQVMLPPSQDGTPVMLKLVACMAVLYSASTPAIAGDRDVPLPVANGKSLLVADSGIAQPTATAVGQQRFTLPDNHARLEIVRPVQLWRMDRIKLAQEPLRIETLTQNLTSDAGGSYAVRDTMRDMRRPHIRKSALSTALVLKIDGNDDTASVGVGGGGVAQAVWRSIPR